MSRPCLHLICSHCVVAPNAKLRREIIPTPVEQDTSPATDDAHAQSAPARMSWSGGGALGACKACRAQLRRRPQSCVLTRTALACMRRCVGAPNSVQNSSISAAISPDPAFPFKARPTVKLDVHRGGPTIFEG